MLPHSKTDFTNGVLHMKLKGKPAFFYIPIILLWVFSCLLIGISFYAMSITINIPDFETSNPTDNISIALNTTITSFGNVFDIIIPFMTGVIGILTIGLLLSIIIIGLLLYFWEKDRKKMILWKEIGFSCERLEFLQGNRIKLNHTELLLNKSQYLTMQKLINSRMSGEALHGIELGENATQVVKRLREELGSKLIEKTLIMNHRGKGYWVDIDPKMVKGAELFLEGIS